MSLLSNYGIKPMSDGGVLYREISIISTPVNDFQVRVVLTTSNFDYSSVLSDGGDIRFYSNTAFLSPLSYFIESWNFNGTSIFWVKVPTSGSTKIYMTYGNPLLTSQSDIDATMEPGTQFIMYVSGTAPAGQQAFQSVIGGGIDTTLSYDWGGGTVSIAGVGNRADYVSIRWKGFVKSTGSTGTYTFYARSDDGQRLYWNDSMIIDNWVDQGPTTRTAAVTWNNTHPQRITYEWFETGGGAYAMLGWVTPNVNTQSQINISFKRAPKYHSSYGDSFLYTPTVSAEISGSEPSVNFITESLLVHLDAGDPLSYPGSGSTVTDLSGNGNNFTLNGPSLINDNGIFAFDFTATGNSINGSIDLRRNWSFECWVKHDVVTPFAFLGQGTTTTNNGLHIWHSSATSLRFGMYSNDTDVNPISTNTNQWYQYVFTYQHTSPFTKQVYRNGSPLTTTVMTGPSQYSGTGTVRIGQNYSSTGNAVTDGKFVNMKLYGKVLSAAEVAQNFNALKARFGL